MHTSKKQDARTTFVELVPLREDDREQFIVDNQEAFLYGATQEFGMRSNHFEDEGQIISRKTIEHTIDANGAESYRIVADGQIAGGLVLNLSADHTKGELELLFVMPNVHSKGIGQAAWHAVEELPPEVRVWSLVTPYFETRNIHFYVNKLGFHIVEFFNSHHPDPNEPDESDEGGMFRFQKIITHTFGRIGNNPKALRQLPTDVFRAGVSSRRAGMLRISYPSRNPQPARRGDTRRHRVWALRKGSVLPYTPTL